MSQIIYMCGVNWQHEIANGSFHSYNTLEELKAKNECWEECGIVKVTMTAEWVEPQDLFGKKS